VSTRPDAARLRVEEVAERDALAAGEEEWWALLSDCPGASPFQSPAWLLAWWDHLGGEGLWTLRLRRGGELVGVCPLFVHTDPERGTRQVTFVGNGVTDRLDLLCRACDSLEAARAVALHLRESRDRWDALDLRDLPADSPLLAAAREIPGAAVEADGVSPALEQPPGAGSVEAVVPRRLAENLRYYRRRAAKEGPVRCEQATAETLDPLLDALFRLHAARWRSRGEPGVLADERVRRFHRAAAARLLERGLLRTYALYVGDRVAAVHHGMCSGRRAVYYLGGFDPELSALSPGTLVLGHALQRAIDEGAESFDFLRGRERYKYAWGATDRPGWRVRVEAA
jgi:CelD/BcsL family acetyltransferase involved in cellulose biosynthesis